MKLTRKAALIGCKNGPWVSTLGLPNVRVAIQGPEGTQVMIEHTGPFGLIQAGVGEVALPECGGVKVSVKEGDPRKVLGFILAGESNVKAHVGA